MFIITPVRRVEKLLPKDKVQSYLMSHEPLGMETEREKLKLSVSYIGTDSIVGT